MINLKSFILILITGLFLNNCSNESDLLSFDEYEDVELHCYFYYPDNKEKYLGRMKGISRCQNAVHNYAFQNNLSKSDNWSYIACTIRKDSDCYEKIK